MCIRDSLFSDVRPEVPKYRWHTLQKRPLYIMRMVAQLQQLNYERRQNPLAVHINFLPLTKDAWQFISDCVGRHRAKWALLKFYQFFNLKSEITEKIM